MDLNIVWFFLIGFLLVGYAILDGFDLGAGILQFFMKSETDKKAVLRAIAPFWDGNEVWLLTGAGAIFAAFPHVYATVFSGFYLAFILLLVCLIFRALSIEFRNEVDSPRWKTFWDKAFSVSSLLATLLMGVALGNIFAGVPIDADMDYTGTFFTLLRPLPVVIGLTGIFMVCMQGAIFLVLRTDSQLQKKAINMARTSWLLFVIFNALCIIVTAVTVPQKVGILFSAYGYFGINIFLVGIVLVPVFLRMGAYVKAFLSSSAVIFSQFLIIAVAIFPNMVPALNPANSLSIYNASSSEKTLFTMLMIALIGMPVVILYTVVVHRIFRKEPVRG